MKLHSLTKHTDKKKKRVGRGYGSGKGGHTSGRGNNGQNSRAGGRLRPTFEGGQNELVHRLPILRGGKRAKLGKKVHILSLQALNKFDDGAVVSYDSLMEKGLVKKGQKVKILNKGKLEKKIKLDGISASKSVISILKGKEIK